MGKKTLVIFIDTLMEPLIESVMVVVNISDLIRFEQLGVFTGEESRKEANFLSFLRFHLVNFSVTQNQA